MSRGDPALAARNAAPADPLALMRSGTGASLARSPAHRGRRGDGPPGALPAGARRRHRRPPRCCSRPPTAQMPPSPRPSARGRAAPSTCRVARPVSPRIRGIPPTDPALPTGSAVLVRALARRTAVFCAWDMRTRLSSAAMSCPVEVRHRPRMILHAEGCVLTRPKRPSPGAGGPSRAVAPRLCTGPGRAPASRPPHLPTAAKGFTA